MKNLFKTTLFIALLFSSCNSEKSTEKIKTWKHEIIETERSFSKMAGEEGISKAFLNYASDDAVLMRNNKLVIGKNAIKERFDKQKPNNGAKLIWEPDFVDVSASGDLGYTYGSYTYSAVDSSGERSKSTGVFHTVWKRQHDGTWKFVWD